MSTLFISHSSSDNAEARKLQAALEEQGHRSVFLDLDPAAGIQAGVSWERTLYTKLRACRAVVALCSDRYLASQWCFAEIALARMEGKELFVLQIDPWSEGTQMPSILTEEQFIDLRTNREDGYKRLWNGFKVKGIVPEEQREWGPEDPPYPGLRAFDETDAPIFFGREQEVRQGVELLNRVQRQGHPPLVMVLGSSGSGKSSLARAGLVPRLRRDGSRWLVVGPFRPGAQPIRELAASLSQAFDRAGEARSTKAIHRRLTAEAGAAPDRRSAASGVAEGRTASEPARQRLLQALQSLGAELTEADAGVARSVRRLEEFLASDPTPEEASVQPSDEPVAKPPDEAAGQSSDEPAVQRPDGPATAGSGGALVELADELRLLRGSSGASVLLVIDQFEELLGHEEEGGGHPANDFLGRLRLALEAQGSPLLALGTMRSDYLGMLQRAEPLQGLGFKSFSVGPMSPDGMRQVIVQPATLGQIEVEDGLPDLLLHDTGTPDALPLLAFTLRAMWDRYRDSRLLAVREYREFGGLQGAIAQVADETLEAALESGDESKLRDAFLSLARPAAEGAGWSRQPVSWEDLDEAVRPMLERFVDQRLLVRRGDGTVEVAHEALFRSWGKLRGWLDENAEGLHLRREIQVDAARWAEAVEEEKAPYLWRGGRLARALELKESGVLPLEDVDRSFVEASDHAQQADAAAEEARRRRELRRARIFALVVGGAFVVAMVLGYFAWRAERKATEQARLARAGQLAALANSQPPEAVDERLWLSVEAVETADLPETRDSLLRALQSGPLATLRGHDAKPIKAVAFSTAAVGGLASAGDGGRVVLWQRAENGWQPQPLPLETSSIVRTVALSPSGEVVATGDDDGMVRLWSVAGPRELGEGQPLHGELVASVAFSPAGDLVASGGKDNRVRLWQVVKDETGAATGLGPAAGSPLEPAHGGTVLAVAFSQDGRWLASAGEDGVVRVWEIAGRRRLYELRGHEGWATTIAFAPEDATRLVSGGEDGTVRLWRLPPVPDSGEVVELETGVILGRHQGMVWTLAFSPPEGGRLVSGGEDGHLRFWHVDLESKSTWKEARAVGAHRGFVNGVAFSPAGDRLISGGADGAVRLWDVDAGAALGDALAPPPGHVQTVAWAPDGERLAWGGLDGVVWIRDTAGGETDGATDEVSGHDGSIYSVALSSSPAGRLLAVGDEYGVWLWQKGDDGEWAGRRLEGEVQTPPEETVWSLSFSPDGDQLVAGYQGGAIWIWEPKDGGWQGRALPAKHESTVFALAFEPGDSLLLSAGDDGAVRVWKEGQGGWSGVPIEGQPPGEVRSLAFARDGRTWVSGGSDAEGRGVIDVWRRQGGDWKRRRLAQLQNVAVYTVALSPDRTLAAAGYDFKLKEGALQLWDVEQGLRLGARLEGHAGQIWSVAFSPSGEMLVSGSDAGELLAWDQGLASWRRRAEAAAGPRH